MVIEKLTTIPLTDLTTLRICCLNKHCGKVIETDLKSLDNYKLTERCPVCGEQFADTLGNGTTQDLLKQLGILLIKLVEKSQFRVEFVIRQEREAVSESGREKP